MLTQGILSAFCDGAYCRESAGTGPVVLKIDLIMGTVHYRSPRDKFMCASIPYPMMVKWTCAILKERIGDAVGVGKGRRKLIGS